MRTVPVKLFVPYIKPLAEKCPDYIIESEVARTVGDICRKTGCLTTTAEVKTQAGRCEYMLNSPEGLEVDMVRHCYVDGMEIPAQTFDNGSQAYGGDWRNTSGKPLCYTFRHRNHLTLIPVPDREYSVRADVTSFIAPDSELIPDMFLTAYLDTVVNGALARIHQLAGQTFASAELAVLYEQRYAVGLNQIKIDATRDFTRTSGRVHFNRII